TLAEDSCNGLLTYAALGPVREGLIRARQRERRIECHRTVDGRAPLWYHSKILILHDCETEQPLGILGRCAQRERGGNRALLRRLRLRRQEGGRYQAGDQGCAGDAKPGGSHST